MKDFGAAPIAREGQPVDFGAGKPPEKPDVDTTYVERRVPRHLTHKVDMLIDKFLIDHGYNPKEI